MSLGAIVILYDAFLSSFTGRLSLVSIILNNTVNIKLLDGRNTRIGNEIGRNSK